jgi:hypothetical protein
MIPVVLPQPAAYAYAVGYYHGRTFNTPRSPWKHEAFLVPYNEGFEKAQVDKKDFDQRYSPDVAGLFSKERK